MANIQISIITISLNNIKGLLRTVDSVLKQKNDLVELIVIDGDSADGSKDYLRDNCDLVDRWISEADLGIYDAMNKGAKLALGNYLLFLNSGDLLNEGAIQNYLWNISSREYDIYYGQIYTVAPNMVLDKSKLHTPSHTNLFYGMSIFHPSTLIKSSLFSKMGMYDIKYKLAGDYKFFLSCFYKKASFKYIEKPLAIFETGGFSSKNANLSLIENIKSKFEILRFHQFAVLTIYTVFKFFSFSFISYILRNLLSSKTYRKIINSFKEYQIN